MLALLSFLEENQRNRYGNENDDINSLEYQKPIYASPYGKYDVNNDDSILNDGDWWNEWIEPSVQYYGNSHGHFDQNPRERHSSKGLNNLFNLRQNEKQILYFSVELQILTKFFAISSFLFNFPYSFLFHSNSS